MKAAVTDNDGSLVEVKMWTSCKFLQNTAFNSDHHEQILRDT